MDISIADQRIPELAQKLYTEDYHAGNLYRQPAKILRYYEFKAQEIIEKDMEAELNGK